jgi:hypothetical protein
MLDHITNIQLKLIPCLSSVASGLPLRSRYQLETISIVYGLHNYSLLY